MASAACGESREPVEGSSEVPRQAPNTVAGDQPKRGMFSYMADAALFEDCSDGARYPVAQEGDYLALERAYLAARREPGEALLATVVGRVEPRPPMEGEGARETLVVAEFVEIRAGYCGEVAEDISM
jgi:uncharacterized lipoprotein NlpE involved in copper resistance